MDKKIKKNLSIKKLVIKKITTPKTGLKAGASWDPNNDTPPCKTR